MSASEFEFAHPEPVVDPKKRAIFEVRNSKELYECMGSYVVIHTTFDKALGIDRGLILQLNQIAVCGLSNDTGKFRSKPVTVHKHVPPKVREIPRLVDEMCDHANLQTDAFYVAAFVLWRLNWIHPFADGNGRVARVLSYICLSITLGFAVDGEFIGQLLDRRDEYYAALEAADRAWAASDQDYLDSEVVRELQHLLFDIYVNLGS
jgi:Fic family protein